MLVEKPYSLTTRRSTLIMIISWLLGKQLPGICTQCGTRDGSTTLLEIDMRHDLLTDRKRIRLPFYSTISFKSFGLLRGSWWLLPPNVEAAPVRHLQQQKRRRTHAVFSLPESSYCCCSQRRYPGCWQNIILPGNRCFPYRKIFPLCSPITHCLPDLLRLAYFLWISIPSTWRRSRYQDDQPFEDRAFTPYRIGAP